MRVPEVSSDSILPHAEWEFRLGAENYRKKLLYDEMVDIPLDRLLAIGYDNLHQNQEALKKVAAEIDPKRPVREVLGRTAEPASCSRSTAAGFSQYIQWADGIYRAEKDHYYSAGTAADPGAHASIRARNHGSFHRYPGSV